MILGTLQGYYIINYFLEAIRRHNLLYVFLVAYLLNLKEPLNVFKQITVHNAEVSILLDIEVGMRK